MHSLCYFPNPAFKAPLVASICASSSTASTAAVRECRAAISPSVLASSTYVKELIMKLISVALGMVVIVIQILNFNDTYGGLDSPWWGFLIGVGLIVSPLLTIGLLLAYILLIIFWIGGVLVMTKFLLGMFGNIGGFVGLIIGILGPFIVLSSMHEDKK